MVPAQNLDPARANATQPGKILNQGDIGLVIDCRRGNL